MFTIEQIKASHALVKSGADFPAHIQRLITLGVTGYENYVADGHTIFKGRNDYVAESPAKYDIKTIAAIANVEELREFLFVHQRGQTDYPTFCAQAAAAGVEKWTVDTTLMTCTYYDATGGEMLQETIPSI